MADVNDRERNFEASNLGWWRVEGEADRRWHNRSDVGAI